MRALRATGLLTLGALAALAVGCGSKSEDATVPPCEQECRDNIAMRAIRDELKLVYNLTLQGNDVGPQDETTPCPLGGTAHLVGTATSNSVQGGTDVDLVIVLDKCAYQRNPGEATQTYDVVISGTITEKGTIAVQPSATTALVIASDALTVTGTVNDPALPYEALACPLKMGQSGGEVAGTICGRKAGYKY